MNSVATVGPRVEMCREDDVRSVMKFINDFWASNHILSRDEALFRWQYDSSLREGRQDAPPSILLAWTGDRIVGMLGLTYMRWQQNGSTYRGAWTSHWFVAPEFRQSHLSLHLIRRAGQAGADLIGSVGINEAAMKLLPNLGYESIDEIPRWLAVIDPRKTMSLIVAAGIGRSRETEIVEACRARVAPQHDALLSGNWHVREWTDADANDWDDAWERHFSSNFTGVVRDSSYIGWRYLRHPSFRYRVLIARDLKSGVVGGIAISRLETVKGRTESVLRILELLPTERSASDSLLNHLMSEARVGGVAFADFYSSKPVEGLKDAGFYVEQLDRGSFQIPLRFQPLEAGGRALNAAIRMPSALRGTLADQLSRGVLYLTKADGDQDRPN